MSGSEKTTLPATGQTASSLEVSQVTRTSLGTFVKGVSGNPAGRPVGAKSRSTHIRAALEEALLRGVTEDFQAIVDQAIQMAKNGNEAMIRLLLGDLLKSARGADSDEDDPLRNVKKVSISITQFLGNQENRAAAEAVDGEYETVEEHP